MYHVGLFTIGFAKAHPFCTPNALMITPQTVMETPNQSPPHTFW